MTTNYTVEFQNLINRIDTTTRPKLDLLISAYEAATDQPLPEQEGLESIRYVLDELKAVFEEILAQYGPFLTAVGTTQMEWVRNGELLPIEETCFADFRDEVNGIIHPVQLTGWDLAGYMRCIVTQNYDIWDEYGVVAKEWLTYSMTYLPDLNSTAIVSIDPFDPKPLIDAYLALDDCSATVTENCKDPAVASEITDNFVQELQLPITTDFLPFLPATVITRPDLGRRALAQATLNLWSEIGIFQTTKELADWINANEHSVFAGDNTTDENARKRMIELIHFTYFQKSQGDRETFLAIWSVTLFQQRRPSGVIVDDRTYDFLNKLLTSTVELSDGDLALFDFDHGLDWNNGTTTGYSQEMLAQIVNNATFTFGSTEVNKLAENDQVLFRNSQSTLWYEYISSSSDNPSQGIFNGVYIMTQGQFSCMQAVLDRKNTVQGCLNELS